jgi:hypothetical protein
MGRRVASRHREGQPLEVIALLPVEVALGRHVADALLEPRNRRRRLAFLLLAPLPEARRRAGVALAPVVGHLRGRLHVYGHLNRPIFRVQRQRLRAAMCQDNAGGAKRRQQWRRRRLTGGVGTRQRVARRRRAHGGWSIR